MSAITNLESMSGLVAFVAAVEAGGFAAAARRLGVSASAIGKAVGRLESRLGVTLLQRTTRSIALTSEGDLLFARAARILEELQDAESEISERRATPRGRLKVSVPTTLGRRVIVPGLNDFLTRYADIELDMGLEDRKVDIVEEGFDLVVRTGDLNDSRLMARKIAPHRFVTCASPDYLKRRGFPMQPNDVLNHACLRYRFPSTGRLEYWAFKNWTPPGRPPSGPVFNDSEAVAIAAIGGLGIAQLPSYLAKNAVEDGRLVPVLTEFTLDRGDLWLVWPPGRIESPRVRVFAEFITNLVQRCEQVELQPV